VVFCYLTKVRMRGMTFPSVIRLRVETDLPNAIAQAARRERMTSSEFARRSIRAAVEAAGVPLSPVAELPSQPPRMAGSGERDAAFPSRNGATGS
jgi:hypothetical protein